MTHQAHKHTHSPPHTNTHAFSIAFLFVFPPSLFATDGYSANQSNVLRMLGYYSLVGLLRVHCLIGDYQGGLKVREAGGGGKRRGCEEEAGESLRNVRGGRVRG